MNWIKKIFTRKPEIVNAEDRLKIIESASWQVGPGVFFSTIIVIAAFLPVFLFNWRSALVILIQLPISVAIGFILLQAFGLSSNIMSLTGIALAIGVVVDDGIVMVENSYRHICDEQIKRTGGQEPNAKI